MQPNTFVKTIVQGKIGVVVYKMIIIA